MAWRSRARVGVYARLWSVVALEVVVEVVVLAFVVVDLFVCWFGLGWGLLCVECVLCSMC